MEFYVSDFLGDTQDLTCEQVGAYMLLLCTMWNKGGYLPEDEAKLARVTRLAASKWKTIRTDVMAFLTLTDLGWTHPKLLRALEKVEGKSLARAEAGSKGGHAKALKDKELALANAKILPQQNPAIFQNQNQSQKETPSPMGANPLPPEPRPGVGEGDARSERQLFAKRIAAAIGVNALGDLQPSLCGPLVAEVESWMAQGCDWMADIVPALATKASGSLPSTPGYWRKIAMGNRDRRLTGPVVAKGALPAAPKPLHAMDRRKRLDAWARGQWPDAWGPKPGEPGCCLNPEDFERAA
jgi:uncharacterized protein YdaU (DUF1376 family)